MTQTDAKSQPGVLIGHVQADTGQPLVNARVTITQVGDRGVMSKRITVTDERGRFQITSLPSGNYSVSVRAPGYVSMSEPEYYRPGDYVGLTMFKGGAITGIVRDRSGEALVNVPVRAFRVRDSEGKASSAAALTYRLTDDRGVYRLYGLAPGEYLICAGGGTRSYAGFNKYEHESPTFYPSSTRQTAEKLTLRLGQQLVDINIAYRGEPGHAVSGLVTGTQASQPGSSIAVALVEKSTGEIRDIAHTLREGAFAFYGVPDGDYYLIAKNVPGNETETAISQPYRFRVAGVDVSRVRLPLSPLASISGRVLLEPRSTETLKKCGPTNSVAADETLISVQRQRTGSQDIIWQTSSVYGTPDERALFSIYGITAGTYAIQAAPSSEMWFTKSVTIDNPSASNPRGRNAATPDSMAGGVFVRINSAMRLTITLAEGGAGLSGRLSPTKAAASSRASMHLVPIERKDLDDPLRFFQTDAKEDRTFSFKSIPPGKYLIFASVIDSKTEGSSSDRSPWNAGDRAIIRKEAQKFGTTIEIHPCQSIHDYLVKYDSSP